MENKENQALQNLSTTNSKMIQIIKPCDILKAKPMINSIKTNGVTYYEKIIMQALSKCLMSLGIVSSQEHIKGLTSDLIEVYKHDSVEDIVEALKAGRQGKYGKTYNKLNMIIIHEWMGYQLEAKAILREREHEKVKKDNKDLEQVIDYNKVKERIDNEREGKKDLTDKERDYRNIKFNYQVKNKDGFVHESNPKLKK